MTSVVPGCGKRPRAGLDRERMDKFAKNGFSLVEVLVSIVVLAIGVMGAAGAQLAAQRAVQQTAFQNFAVQLAAEIAEAIRAGGRQKLPLETPLTQLDYQSAVHGRPELPAKLCYVDDCDAGEFSQFELYEWKKRVETALPAGRLQICRDSSHAADRSGEVLAWGCDEATDDGAAIVIKLGWRSRNPDGSSDASANGDFPPLVAVTINAVAE